MKLKNIITGLAAALALSNAGPSYCKIHETANNEPIEQYVEHNESVKENNNAVEGTESSANNIQRAWYSSISTRGKDLGFDYFVKELQGDGWISLQSSLYHGGMSKELSLNFGTVYKRFFFGGSTGFFEPLEELDGTSFAKMQFGSSNKRGLRFRTGIGFMKIPNLTYGYLEGFGVSEKFGNVHGAVVWDRRFGHLQVFTNTLLSIYVPFNRQKIPRRLPVARTSLSVIGDPSIYGLSHLDIEACFRRNYENLSLGISSRATITGTIVHEHMANVSLKFGDLKLSYSIGPKIFHNLYMDFVGFDKINIFAYNEGVHLSQKLEAALKLDDIILQAYGTSGQYSKESYAVAGSLGRVFGDYKAEVYCAYDSFFETFNAGIMLSFNIPENPKKYFKPRYHTQTAKKEGYLFTSHKKDAEAYKDYMHRKYGQTLEEAARKVHSYEDIANIAMLLSYRDVEYGFEDAETVYKNGGSNCEGINGSLIPYLAREALGLDAKFAVILSPHVQHVIALVFNEKGTIDIFDYSRIYRTGEKDAMKAISKVYPSYFFSIGLPSPLTKMIWDKMEKPIF